MQPSLIRLSGLSIYPVKSLGGIDLQRSELDSFGLHYDRRWMLVDQAGHFLSQRRLPRMTLIQPAIESDRLLLRADGQQPLSLPLHPQGDEWIEVQVWEDRCRGLVCSAEADRWLSEFLETPCRLVYMPDSTRRQVDPDYALSSDHTAFSDGFPLLLISQASLDDLNRRLPVALPMRRFRPNLVVDGCTPYAEDRWRRIQIGGVDFRVVKPCSRCVITTIDPQSAQRGEEPLKTLSGYRRQGNKVLFGQNLLHNAEGELALGLPVELLEVSGE
ncbi:MOSC domain-containing protein [endosymbiont of Ridgeia piscesae]|jgi:uncharacterized protein YcbX|uniref:MOSC domain-containing protein n=1 Tax=endosymbiont of Ridgeia piscesae TaxID=54398 RepID=A0A0T5Z380_9GAMM|nr:MOSC N-terminal beta barrel domain-containing protein [endosymbiont of Ridgeia piscesae]KRT53951.1 hypothetical protein Ga0074115_10253 [endosymbiont of Ridgeia piscesae]KRT57296.1 hypothetical protein Ga0076813_11323 [endosymbiont of Ridgeia piscesae]